MMLEITFANFVPVNGGRPAVNTLSISESLISNESRMSETSASVTPSSKSLRVSVSGISNTLPLGDCSFSSWFLTFSFASFTAAIWRRRIIFSCATNSANLTYSLTVSSRLERISSSSPQRFSSKPESGKPISVRRCVFFQRILSCSSIDLISSRRPFRSFSISLNCSNLNWSVNFAWSLTSPTFRELDIPPNRLLTDWRMTFGRTSFAPIFLTSNSPVCKSRAPKTICPSLFLLKQTTLQRGFVGVDHILGESNSSGRKSPSFRALTGDVRIVENGSSSVGIFAL